MEFLILEDGFKLLYNKQEIITHTNEKPFIYVGYGEETVDMYRGNFKIDDYIIERYPIRNVTIEQHDKKYTLNFENKLKANIEQADGLFIINFEKIDDKINRFWIRINSDEKENCYGCGEQMSYFILRGRSFPIWTSEPGVGRDKNTYETWRSDVENKAGGD